MLCKSCKHYNSNSCDLHALEDNCLDFQPDLSTIEFIEPVKSDIKVINYNDIRQELIDYLYDFHVRADIKIESLADDILSIVKL